MNDADGAAGRRSDAARGPTTKTDIGETVEKPEVSPAGADETPLIESARRGDRAAFDQLIGRHLQHVWAVVWRILRHHEDTEDVVQEVFLTAFQALPRYRGDARLSTWLHRIAVTRALNHLDRKEEKMRRALRSLESAPEPASGDGPAGWSLHGSPTPLEALEAEELMRRLAECLSRLPGAWRLVLTLRDVDARSYDEIARLAGLALGTVRSRLSRARLALRQCVGGDAP
ncbi:MAG TPA: sigma-70 family RNA polymerase sigma factor [Candidatus Polarisedimenticolia bacterium]|nr:sigma-70 family RNA polymerase sigma factor [Candidatus Polarisedimenticolia bacterium]